MKPCKYCNRPAEYRVENLYRPIRACHQHRDHATASVNHSDPEVTPLKTATLELKTLDTDIFSVQLTDGTPRAYVNRGHGYINLDTGTIGKELRHSQAKFEITEDDGDTVIYAETLRERKEVLRIGNTEE